MEKDLRDALVAGLIAAGYRVEVTTVDHSLTEKLVHGEWDVLVFDLAAHDVFQHSVDKVPQPIPAAC